MADEVFLTGATGFVGGHVLDSLLESGYAVRALVRKGDDHQLRSQISTGRADGMMTMEQSLADLVRAGRITQDTAYAHCFRTDDLLRYLG